jgi:hypothetical protein
VTSSLGLSLYYNAVIFVERQIHARVFVSK